MVDGFHGRVLQSATCPRPLGRRANSVKKTNSKINAEEVLTPERSDFYFQWQMVQQNCKGDLELLENPLSGETNS